jgi:orotidine-5'-phosphate decarboxylase
MKGIEPFGDRLLARVDEKHSCSVVGLDPDYARIPEVFKGPANSSGGRSFRCMADSIIAFNRCIIDVAAPLVPAVKPQIAYYEMYGLEGMRAFVETVSYAKEKGLLVIGDVKRNDIGSTAGAYSTAYLGGVAMGEGTVETGFDVDAVTVNAFLGWDGVRPFMEDAVRYGKGVFILVKTSNPSSAEFQDLRLADGGAPLYEWVARKVHEWGQNAVGRRGYSSLGAVVGATYPAHARALRSLMPRAIFLVPGYGAQGGAGKDIVACFNEDGYGALVNASRSINYPHGQDLSISLEEFKQRVREAVLAMNADIDGSLRSAGRKG